LSGTPGRAWPNNINSAQIRTERISSKTVSAHSAAKFLFRRASRQRALIGGFSGAVSDDILLPLQAAIAFLANGIVNF